jgi:hypothetical protein
MKIIKEGNKTSDRVGAGGRWSIQNSCLSGPHMEVAFDFQLM